MNPIATTALLVISLALFAYTARRRWRWLTAGRRRSPGPRLDRVGERVRLTLRETLGQKRLTRYRLAGLAHKAIFFGFLVFALRSLILFGRGFAHDPGFGFVVLDRGTLLGNVFGLVKDVYVLLVVGGALVFLYYRLVARLPRLTLSREGVGILALILAMMVADVVYDGAGQALASRSAADAGSAQASLHAWEPLGWLLAHALEPLPEMAVSILWRGGFWSHLAFVLIFLNLLPYSKHFHVITVVPNIFFQDLGPPGRMRPIEDLEGMLEREEPLGVRTIDQLGWKDILDLYTCTECGRCTDQCPAARTGKQLSPKHLIMELRDVLYESQPSRGPAGDTSSDESPANTPSKPHPDLVPSPIQPEVLWACTTCGACEEECPVFIKHVGKIMDLRRSLVMERGECAASLQEAFQSIEVTGSPYGVGPEDRLSWARGLDVPVRADVDQIDVLLWVGCAPATDERGKSIARATAQLLNRAGVKWAVLGTEERCTGDVARRAGNEYLFQAMARANIETLDRYETRRILTICPHCYNTLKNEYPDFGGRYDVVHHADFLADLVRAGRLRPSRSTDMTIAYHDSCYLGRLNGLYDPPRSVLESIPGLTIVEPEQTRDRGMCCGAGGAQMFKEDEPGQERVSVARTRQLVATGADGVATACPFCMRMLTDALNLTGQEHVRQLDIAEILLESLDPLASDETSDAPASTTA